MFFHECAFSTAWQIPASTCLVSWREPRAERLAKQKQKGINFFSCVSCTVPKATEPDFPVCAQMRGEGGVVSLGTTQITFKTAMERPSLCTVTADRVQNQLNTPSPASSPCTAVPGAADCAQPRSCNWHYITIYLSYCVTLLFLCFLPLQTPFSH